MCCVLGAVRAVQSSNAAGQGLQRLSGMCLSKSDQVHYHPTLALDVLLKQVCQGCRQHARSLVLTARHDMSYLPGLIVRAVLELVGPIRSRQALMASGFDSFRAQRGPLVMKSTSVGKKDLPCWSSTPDRETSLANSCQ